MKKPHAPSSVEDWQAVWTRTFPANIKGLSLARERHALLFWDSAHWLHLLNPAGQTQAQRQFPGLTSAAISDDGSAFVTGQETGQVRWLAPDLTDRWDKQLPHAITAVTVDPHGQYLAAATGGSQAFV